MTPPRRRLLPWTLLGVLAIGLAGTALLVGPAAKPPLARAADEKAKPDDRVKAPELEGGAGWLNTSGPLKLADLKGKIVVLDFWTYCCINCIHTLPDLAKLEKKYANQIVVVGVHSAKFETEKESNNIKEAILRYEISHPVVNDAKMAIWNNYGVRSWPTLAVIDPEGYYLGSLSGEGNLPVLERVIDRLIADHRAMKTLDEKPMRFDLVRYREKGDTPLFFPGKVLADAASNRLFVADSTHHRVVVSDLAGKVQLVAGDGTFGRADGPADKARFDDPQGMTLVGDTLYVADRKNHVIRTIDLKTKVVATVAGTGEQNRDRSAAGKALETGLNSPWDVLAHNGKIFIAMAGHHQIWTLDPAAGMVAPFAGNGRENIKDGPLPASNFAQPSGLTTDGTFLYVADCETSAVRKLLLDGSGTVETLVGTGLFDFGDRDGVATETDKDKKPLLQHAIAVQYVDGLVYIADTYNSKLKTIDPKTRDLRTFLSGEGKMAPLNEPAGLSAANGKLYVADTNGHRIQVIDIATKAVATLNLEGLTPPKGE